MSEAIDAFDKIHRKNFRSRTFKSGKFRYGKHKPLTLFQKAAFPPSMSLNGLLSVLIALLLMIMLGFTVVPLPSPFNWGGHSIGVSPMVQYTFQIPFALFIAAFLGPFLGTLTLALFLLTGLAIFPIFANGGGWQYVSQPGFGYLLGLLASAYLVGATLPHAFHKQNEASCSLKILRQAVFGVLGVHILGLFYLFVLTLTHWVSSWQECMNLALHLTIEPLPYDLVATMVLLPLVRSCRFLLWFALY